MHLAGVEVIEASRAVLVGDHGERPRPGAVRPTREQGGRRAAAGAERPVRRALVHGSTYDATDEAAGEHDRCGAAREREPDLRPDGGNGHSLRVGVAVAERDDRSSTGRCERDVAGAVQRVRTRPGTCDSSARGGVARARRETCDEAEHENLEPEQRCDLPALVRRRSKSSASTHYPQGGL